MTEERVCCHAVASLLAAHGIKEIVISPGSRNAPLIEALASVEGFNITVVVDERSAGFIAIGKASVNQSCTVLVCTSGTAILNYAPAIAESYYRNIPLLVITADRPHEWIDRNDSQTIVQQDVYHNYIKQYFSLDCRDDYRYRDIVVNDSINATTILPMGPVHLNIEIPDPSLSDNEKIIGDNQYPKTIKRIEPSWLLSKSTISEIAERLKSPARVMILAGGYAPNQKLNRAIVRLNSFGNFITIADMNANLHGYGVINTIDTFLSGVDNHELDSLKPDIVITHGAAIISSQLKKYIRNANIEHWHIGISRISQDTFGKMSLQISSEPSVFYPQLLSVMRKSTLTSYFSKSWIDTCNRIQEKARSYIEAIGWSDLKAVNILLSMMPQKWNLHLSNGMSARYAQLLPIKCHRIDCNRGVSGIEGSTSTAIGASTVYSGTTLLITGDMSASYDLNALTLPFIPARFKMIVMCNGGGGIFKYIKGTRKYKDVDKYLTVNQNYHIENIARTIGFNVLSAHNENELRNGFRSMMNESKVPSLMTVYTSSDESADIMRQYIHRNINI